LPDWDLETFAANLRTHSGDLALCAGFLVNALSAALPAEMLQVERRKRMFPHVTEFFAIGTAVRPIRDDHVIPVRQLVLGLDTWGLATRSVRLGRTRARKPFATGQTACMFPRTAQHQWWFASPERKNRSQAIGLRLVIAYHQRDAASVERLLPADDHEIRLVMGALENGLLALNQLCPPGPPDEVWERVTPILDACAPSGVASRARALLAAMTHAMHNATLGEVYERKEQDPYLGAHLFAAITATRVDEHEGNLQRMQEKVDELDPH
jgi:hypothetical protein